MKQRYVPALAALAMMLALPSTPGDIRAAEPPKIQIPKPGVPQIMTLEGRFIRAAYNNEGYAILGYRLANQLVGEKWMLLEVGFTLRDGVPNYDMPREALSLETPDGQTIAMATLAESREGPIARLENRAKVASDKINYFPPTARQACRLGFFSDLDDSAPAWDKVELASQRACMGRIFFNIPAGIARGQHWLNVKLANSVIRVPFRILTDEEYKLLDKNYKNIEQQVEEAFKKKE